MSYNFFADFGGTITGERFIGREELLASIAGRVFGPKGYGSLSVVGLPRIGKTSLIEEALNRYSGTCHVPLLVGRVDVGSTDSVPNLFATLVTELLKSPTADTLGQRTMVAAEAVMAAPLNPADPLQRFFRELVREGVRPVCVFEEFDAGRYLFTQTPQSFHWLRGLASTASYKAALIFISKRRLEDVSRLAGHSSSYWANVLMRITLPPFKPDEQEEFFRRLHDQGVNLDDKVKAEVLSVCGRHPFLLDAFGFYAVEEVRARRPLTVEWFQRQMRDTIRVTFQEIVTILEDGQLFGKAVQIMAGPQWDVDQHDVDALEEYGVLEIDDKELRTFSTTFNDYLRFRGEGGDLWPTWRDTERGVRATLTTLLEQTYGPQWVAALKKMRVADRLQAAENTMMNDIKKFGATAPDNVLAYTYPKDLYDIMTLNWAKLGEPFLGPDRTDWAKKFELLSRVRNPLAHNREEAVTPDERKIAAGICEQLLDRIKKWQDALENA